MRRRELVGAASAAQQTGAFPRQSGSCGIDSFVRLKAYLPSKLRSITGGQADWQETGPLGRRVLYKSIRQEGELQKSVLWVTSRLQP